MPYTGSISAYSNVSSSLLQQWASGLHNGIQAAGLLNANAAGSTDPATFTTITGSAANYGYQVYKFNDTLAPVAPIYIKVEYMNRTSAPPFATVPSINVSIGTQLAGATIGGQAVQNLRFQYTGGTGNPLPFYNSLFAGGDGFLNMALWYDQLAQSLGQWLISVERTRDADGNPTTQGFYYHMNGCENAQTNRAGYIPSSGSIPVSQQRFGVMQSPAGAATFYGGAMMPGRIFGFDGGAHPYPITALMYVQGGQFVTEKLFQYQVTNTINATFLKFPTNVYNTADQNMQGRVAMRIL